MGPDAERDRHDREGDRQQDHTLHQIMVEAADGELGGDATGGSSGGGDGRSSNASSISSWMGWWAVSMVIIAVAFVA